MSSVNELRKEKKMIESQILDMLKEFESKYDVVISDIEITRMYEIGGKSEIYCVELKVLL